MVLDGRMLHLELTAGVSGTAHVYGLRVEDVDLDEVAGCQLLKSSLVPSPLLFALFHQSPSCISLGVSDCNNIDITCNKCSSDDRQ